MVGGGIQMSVLKMYATGCSPNSRTVPISLPEPKITIENSNVFDYKFKEVVACDDDTAMSIDFAVIDDKWAYYCKAIEKVTVNSWRFDFGLSGIKSHMLQGGTQIKGIWNKTNEHLDKRVQTPSERGYEIADRKELPNCLPKGWVWVEIKVRLKGYIRETAHVSVPSEGERNIILGFFTNKVESDNSDMMSIHDVVYNLSSFTYCRDSSIFLQSSYFSLILLF